MNNLKLAVRNLLRNRRRSVTTISAMVIGMVALLLFGGFISSIYFGLQTSIVRSQGHLHIYPQGYLEFGASRPTDYFIDDYKSLIQQIKKDDWLQQHIEVITPVVNLSGIAGNYSADTSKTFIGRGVVPSEQNQMQGWDKHRLEMKPLYLSLNDNNINQGVVGVGMAKMLNLCESLKVTNCKDRPITTTEGSVDDEILALQSLVEEENTSPQNQKVQIDLLASTGTGAPNAVSLTIVKAQQQANKVLDDSFIIMNLQQAQKLVFADNLRVSAIVLQLKNTDSMTEAQQRLMILLDEIGHEQAFEVKNYTQFNAEFFQIVSMFLFIFMFVALMISLVVLFTTINTMTMSVMERISEIGSLRAMGLRRSVIRWQFMLEGAVIGIAGATLGVLLATLLTLIFNSSGFTWSPPGSAESSNLQILLFTNPLLLLGTWGLMAGVATISSLVPARFAAKMNIVDAIRNH